MSKNEIRRPALCRLVQSIAVASALGSIPAQALAQTSLCCPADITGSGSVDGVDLALVLTTWGSSGQQGVLNCDLNDDGIVSAPDLTLVLSSWGTCPTPCLKTRLTGCMRFADGTPGAQAIVSTNFGSAAVADSAGHFDFIVEAPSASAELAVTIVTEFDGMPHAASKNTLSVEFEGVTNVGIILLTPRSTCEVSNWLPVASGSGQSNGAVYTLRHFDDGTGAKVYAGGSFTILNGIPASHIARWNGRTWEPVGAGLNGYVDVLEVFDDGSGPALYALGSFAGSVARWNGKAWTIIGGLSMYWDTHIPTVYAATVFDDGSGEALYVGGHFDYAGGNAANGLAKWNGKVWTPVGNSLNFGAYFTSLAVFDAGAGRSLYAAAGVLGVGGSTTAWRVGLWDGTAWDLSYGVMDYTINALTVFDAGEGPRLTAGGGFTYAGGSQARGVAQWSGASWVPVGTGLTIGGATKLVPFTDASGTSLFVFGGFRLGNNPEYQAAARWDSANGWRDVGVGPNSDVRAAAIFDDGTGPSIFVGGWFTSVGSNSAAGVARWGCQP